MYTAVERKEKVQYYTGRDGKEKNAQTKLLKGRLRAYNNEKKKKKKKKRGNPQKNQSAPINKQRVLQKRRGMSK